jgi:prepilin-type N-terminal cleavage/methylation domain-containing protein
MNTRLDIKRGFTLIELLVVIAIIGILSSVVLASLNAARDKGADASIKSSIGNMRAQAELYYDENGLSYFGMCASSVIQTALAQADSTNKAGGVRCVDGSSVANAWALEAQLVSSSTSYYCVDSTGASEVYGASTISNTAGSEDSVCG